MASRNCKDINVNKKEALNLVGTESSWSSVVTTVRMKPLLAEPGGGKSGISTTNQVKIS